MQLHQQNIGKDAQSDPTLKIVRKDWLKLPKYTPVSPIDVLAEELGMNVEDMVKLDANESPFGPIQEIVDAVKETPNMHRYPDPFQLHMRRDIANYTNDFFAASAPASSAASLELHDNCNGHCAVTGVANDNGNGHCNSVNQIVTEENIVCGCGSDEFIELLIKLVDASGDGEAVVSCSPTFGMYSFLSKMAKSNYVDVPRVNAPNYDLEMTSLKKALTITPGTKVLFLATPNNPTGLPTCLAEIKELLAIENVMVVVDQAYAEFQLTDEVYPQFAKETNEVIPLIHQYPNLVVLRTFSKWAGLAGMRLGYAISNKFLVEKLMSLKQPYNYTIAAEVSCRAALKHKAKIMREQVAKLHIERKRMVDLLKQFAWLTPAPSVTNFVLFTVEPEKALREKMDKKVEIDFNAKNVFEALKRKGVLVRYYASNDLKNCLRISVGTSAETDRLVKALKEIDVTM